jgi:hypothetical protein
MGKDPHLMADAERTEWLRQCATHTRDYLFSVAQPLVYKRPDGHTVAEYLDGSIIVIR